MLLGNKEDFAVECYHEPDYPNDHGWVFGRMCIWCQGTVLGDPNEPACMLNVTEGCVENCLAQLDNLRDETVDDLPDEAAYDLLEAAIYGPVDRSSAQIHADSIRYRKFDFFTPWGESFDKNRGFLIEVDGGYRVLYSHLSGYTGGARVSREGLINALRGFLDWMAVEKAKLPTAGWAAGG